MRISYISDPFYLHLPYPLILIISFVNSSVLLLHDRWLKDCTFYREIYEQIDDVSLMPRIDWGPVFNEKQVGTIGDLKSFLQLLSVCYIHICFSYSIIRTIPYIASAAKPLYIIL